MPIKDPHHTYTITEPGKEARTFTGEGTRVMLANAHPDAVIERIVVASTPSGCTVPAGTFRAEPTEEEIRAMTRDELRACARAIPLAGYSKLNRDELAGAVSAALGV